MRDLIEKYINIPAVSGSEENLRQAILNEISPFADTTVDNMGNIIAFKKGKSEPKVRLMLDAHMDEIGFIITGVTDDGYLRFSKVGGIDNKVLLGRRVKIGDITGVIGGCAVHLIKGDDRLTVQPADKLLIDIGASSKEEALKYVKIGDTAIFDSTYFDLGNKIAGRALDDRIGCAVLTKLIQSDLAYDMYFTFTVQEELGCRGAVAAAFSVEPQAAIVVETTTAADISDVKKEEQVCVLGNGAAVSFMDTGAVYDKKYYNAAMEIAADSGIKVQPKSAVAGGNNSSAIHKSRGGVRTISLSLPCRYIHSAFCVSDTDDIKSLYSLVLSLCEKIASGEID